jgi:hypothetical protein
MSKKDLDQPDIGTALVEVRGEAVPQHVHRHLLVQTGM